MKTKHGKNRRRKERIWKIAMMGCTLFTCSILVLVIGYVFLQGVKGLSINLLTTQPSYLSGNVGILPDILNTVYLLIVAVAVLIPLGTGAAVYLSEYAKNKKIVGIIDYTIEILSGIPSVIYGLVGMLFFCEFLAMRTSILAGALTVAVMNLPTVIRVTGESLSSVRKGLREGAYGLGASKWRVLYAIVLPECMDGIITGIILSTGRILGESAALLFTAGFAHTLHGFLDAISSPGATLTVALYVYAKEDGKFQTAFSIALILLFLALLVDLSAELVKRNFNRKRKF